MPRRHDQLQDARHFLQMVGVELRRIAELECAQLELAMKLRYIASQCENEADYIDNATQDTTAD